MDDCGECKVAKPAVIRKGSIPKAPFWTRLRRRSQRAWSEFRLQRVKAHYRRGIGAGQERTVAFVLGCQRSGTNMVLRTLGLSLDVDTVEESDQRCFRDGRIMDRQTRNALIARSTARCVIFKPICDSHRAVELFSEHTGSKAVWVYRRYQDVANSAVRYWGDQMQTFIEDLLQGGGDWGIAQWNREKVTDGCTARMKEAAADGLDPYGGAALFWYMRNHTFFDQELKHCPSTTLLRYEHAVTESAREFERLCRFLNIRFEPAMVDKVFPTSLGKHPRPPISRRVERLCDEMMEQLDAAHASMAKSLAVAPKKG